MLVIKAKHKESGTVYQFTPTEWYTEQQTGNYYYVATLNISEQTQPITQKTVTVKRGCGCANKRK